jgi:hypothetical protein
MIASAIGRPATGREILTFQGVVRCPTPEVIPEDVQRWTFKRRGTLVLSILKGETSVQEAARMHGLIHPIL